MTQLSLLPDTCYCCGAEATREAGRAMHWDLCDECRDACFRRVQGEIVFVCPAHGEMMPVDVPEESVRWFKKSTWKNSYPVKVESGAKLWLLDWA